MTSSAPTTKNFCQFEGCLCISKHDGYCWINNDQLTGKFSKTPVVVGTITVNANSNRRKWTGATWESMCNIEGCETFSFGRGLCRRHFIEFPNRARPLPNDQ